MNKQALYQGESRLETLLQNMSPELSDVEYVFCTFPDARYGTHHTLNPIGAFQEPEGLTLILPKFEADQHTFPYTGSYRKISLRVHSSLSAVGLTAVVSQALATHDISANIVAGYFHDHVFVPAQKASEASIILRELSASANSPEA